jgi:integrase/recombinase XerD
MSGGPYGRGKAPERACLPVSQWPEADRRLWLAACAPGDILDDEVGARSGHARISNTKAAKGNGRWLTFLSLSAKEALAEAPADRITPDRVRAYVDSLIAIGNSTQTILNRLQELGEVAKVMDPNRRWSFINDLASRIRAHHRPTRDKSNLRLSDELVELGFELMRAAADLVGLAAAIAYRDGLLIAVLALIPLRRRNLADLVLGLTLVREGLSWIVAFGEDDTKTHTAFEVPLPDVLAAALEAYLNIHRPILVARSGRWARPIDGALWVSTDGSPMTQMALYDRIRARTKDHFGVAINPHLFRDAAATTLAIADPAHVRVAAPLLGHRTFATTERHYKQARALEAHRTFVDALNEAGGRNDRHRFRRQAQTEHDEATEPKEGCPRE